LDTFQTATMSEFCWFPHVNACNVAGSLEIGNVLLDPKVLAGTGAYARCLNLWKLSMGSRRMAAESDLTGIPWHGKLKIQVSHESGL
jgi:hypothetical protein